MAAALFRKILNTPYWTFYAALFTLFLALGAWAGVAIAGWIPSEVLQWKTIPEANGQATSLPANGQRNLLLIGVDDLEGETPVLESLWLALYFPGRSPITLMPLYPQTGEPEDLQELAILKAFSLARSGEPSESFFERLRHEQVWWNGYVLLDETAAAALLDMLGGIEMDNQQVVGLQAIAGIPRAIDDRSEALDAQVRLLRSACTQAGKQTKIWPEITLQAGELGDHLRTDVYLPELVKEWAQAAGPVPALECEFPLQALNLYSERTQ